MPADDKIQAPPRSLRPRNPQLPPLPQQPPPQQPVASQIPAPERIQPVAPRPPKENSSGWGWIVLVVIAGGMGWWLYQQREESPSSDVPAIESTQATAEGEILVDARPWGRIESVLATGSEDVAPLPAGSPFTPRVVTLSAGTYDITVSHPGVDSRTCQVEIGDGTPQICEVRFFDTDPHAYFRELGW